MFYKTLFLFVLCIFRIFAGFSQERKDSLGHLPIEFARFVKNPNQHYGFYERVGKDKKGTLEIEVFKSIGKAQSDVVDFKINRLKIPSIDSIEFFIHSNRIPSSKINEVKSRVFLPASNKDYDVGRSMRDA
jgi:hypothetical protein